MITKFRYHRENLAIAKFSLWLRKFRYDLEIFAIIAKISLLHSEISKPLPTSSSLHFSSSSLIFLHPRLDEIAENSYELSINQHNYDAKLDMMVEAYETCKTTKNNLETKLVILMDLHMSIGLNNMISTQKALKTYLK